MSEARCFHCHNPVPDGVNITISKNGAQHPVCCYGCQSVAELILSGGLDQFYQFREGELDQPESLDSEQLQQMAVYNQSDILDRISQSQENGHRSIQLSIGGITCAACVWLLEQYIRKIPGIAEFWVNLTTHRAELVWNQNVTALSQIFAAIRKIGFSAQPYSANQEEKRLQDEQKSMLIRLGVAGIGMMQNMMLAVPSYFGLQDDTQAYIDLFRYISLLVALPVVLYAANPFFKAAWRDLKLRHLTMDVPVSIAIGGAFLASAWITVTDGPEVYYDSVCMFTFFLLLGRYLESRARVSAARSNASVRSSLPAFVTRLHGDDSEQVIAIDDLRVGDRIRVKPGELIPVDGTVLSGISQVNNAALTGEFSPQRTGPENRVLSGSVNIENSLEIRVDALNKDSHLSTINRLVDRALQDRPRLATLSDKVASYFVAGVLLTALIVGLIWWQIDPEHTFAITLSVLVVTCPCALSLATPTALTVATTALRESGFILSRGHVLETLAKADRFVFDKTGTLTRGELNITRVDVLSELPEARLLAIAAALEADSRHPIARAFRHIETTPAVDLENQTGLGVTGIVDGQRYRLGSAAFCDAPEDTGDTRDGITQTIYLSSEHKLLGRIHLSDTLRPGASDTVSTLQQRGAGVSVLTGDSSAHADSTASALGIEDLQKSLKPEDKLARARQWQEQGDTVVMVGDGINDVPAMAGSHLSVAMQNASDLTQLKADALILNPDLHTLIFAIDKAKATFRVIRQNLSWALAYNLTALPLAAAGLVPPWAAAIGMSLSSLIVVINALRLSRTQPSAAG